MADKTVSIDIKTTSDTSGAKQATQALDAVNTSSKKLTTGSEAAGKNMGKMGMLANQASFQLGDFTQQVSMGTSGITAFAQQAPQLIGAFQMAGVMSGPLTLALSGIAVALPLIAVGIRAMGGGLSDAAESANDATIAINKFGKRTTEELHNEIVAREEAIDREAASIGKLDQKWAQTAKASREYSDAVLENARAYHEIQTKIAEALGFKVDRMREIEEMEQAREDKLRKKAGDDLKALQDQQAEAEQKAAALMVQLAAKDALAQKAADALEQARAESKALREKKRSMEEAVKNDPRWLVRVNNNLLGTEADDEIKQRHTAATEARAQLAKDGPMDASQKQNENRIKSLAEDVKRLDRAVGSLNDDAQQAANEVADGAQKVKIRSKEITETLQRGITVLNGESFLSGQTAVAEQLTAAMGKIQTNNTRMTGAKDGIAKAASNHALTVTEMSRLGEQLRAITGGLQSGAVKPMTGAVENTAQMITLLFTLQAEVDRQAQQIKSLGATRR